MPILRWGKFIRSCRLSYFHRHDEKKGQEHLDSAVRIFEEQSKVAEMEEVTLQMCRYLSDKGDHWGAYERMERYHQYMMRQFEQNGIVEQCEAGHLRWIDEHTVVVNRHEIDVKNIRSTLTVLCG